MRINNLKIRTMGKMRKEKKGQGFQTKNVLRKIQQIASNGANFDLINKEENPEKLVNGDLKKMPKGESLESLSYRLSGLAR